MKSSYYQTGFCMLEVLIAWSLVVVVAMLVLSLERESMQQIHEDWLYSQAINIAANLAELCRADEHCYTESMAYHEWVKQAEKKLPQFHTKIVCDDSVCHVKLWWYQKHAYHYQLMFTL